MPTLWDAGKHGSNNPFLNLFSSIDLVFIFQGILSLLALVFAYDTLAGERERGTLRLVLTHPVRHGQILFAKYISGMICLLIPLLMCVLLVLIMLTTSASVFLSTADFSTYRWRRFYVVCLSVPVLPYRHADFSGDAPNKYCAHACDVCLGVLGAGVSKYDSDRS